MLAVAGGILIAALVLFLGWLGLSAIGIGNKSGGAILLCIAALIAAVAIL